MRLFHWLVVYHHAPRPNQFLLYRFKHYSESRLSNTSGQLLANNRQCMKALVGQVTHLLALYYRRLNLNFMLWFVVLTDPTAFLSFLKADVNCFH